MKRISIARDHEVLSLITGVTFATVPAWYGATRRDLKLDIIVPKDRTNHPKLPCIVWICGGAFLVNDRSVWIPEMMDYARAGYAVASVEYRTSNDAGFPEQLTDIKAAIRFLRAHAEEFCLDTERFAVMGESAGGTLASLTGVTGGQKEYDTGDWPEYSSGVQAVVDYYGVTDFTLRMGRGAAEDASAGVGLPEAGAANSGADEQDEEGIVPDFATAAFLGSGRRGRENLVRASAVKQVTKDAPPFLILHGENDDLVELENSRRMYDALREAGVRAEFYLVEGAGHGDPLFYQKDMEKVVLEFLKEVLL